MRSAVLRAHAFGVKTYLTLNTLVTDRELPAFLDAAIEAARAGVDALIVADLGGAQAIRRILPSIELHASTQMSGHSSEMGKQLKELGFSRMVIARETSLEDLKSTVQNSPIEVEYFIHGALCVSHSGQCLFSSLVGGRSGNRGECAQPCRLPYGCAGCASKREGYPLSLKDLSLASHVPLLIESGVSSLKIEGRMKSAEYVRDVTSIWRRLLDENRGATKEELSRLAETFSRGGFTDGYFTGRIGHSMLGVRSSDDKESTRSLAPFEGLTKKLPLQLSFVMKQDLPMTLTLSDGSRSVTVCGEIPQTALNAPLTPDAVEKSLSKFGGTVYCIEQFSCDMDEGLMVPVSHLNQLRRSAVSAWEEGLPRPATAEPLSYHPQKPKDKRSEEKSARFYKATQVTDAARNYFDRIYLPLREHQKDIEGVVLPAVIFDSEQNETERLLALARQNGAKYALVGNLGHLEAVKRAGLIPVGDFRLNITNNETAQEMESLGFESFLLSPELTLPQTRDVGSNRSVIVYGRIPLMTLEKCVIKEISNCDICKSGKVRLRDRRGVEFPVLREWEHRNVVYNSLPTCMSDRAADLVKSGISNQHFIFSTESAKEVDEVISAFRRRSPLPFAVRRI